MREASERSLFNWKRRDRKDAEIHEMIMKHLVSKVYDYVCVINLSENTLYVDFDQVTEAWDWTNEEHDYDEARFSLSDNFVATEDCENFIKKTSARYIQETLDKQNDLIFTAHFMDSNGELRVKMFSYTYLDKENGLVLTTMEDTTSLLYRDPLTGEWNRRGFIQEVENVLDDLQAVEQFSILYINLRGFKAVNELFGTKGGDRALRAVPKLLHDSFLEPRVVGRIGADHFVCLVESDRMDEKKLSELLHQTYIVNNQSIDLYAVCGIYTIGDNVGKTSVSNMLDAAKLAQAHIEDEYVKPHAIFDEDMRKVYLEKNETLSELNTALENNEFKVYYQPVYDVRTGKIASAEALVRWKRTNGDMVSPGVFVPALEESGRISQMDLFVERKVIQFLEKRQEKEKFMVPVSINMSQMDFYDRDMMASVLLDVSNTTLPLNYTRFEVTETAYSSVAENNRNAILDMKNIGVKFYLDDFGSGYSSFSTIRDYDFDIIKMDMGFVQKIGTSVKADAIIHSIIEMAHMIGSKVVAEGAETEEQVSFLADCGCDYIQGYYYSKPLPEEEFEELLDKIA